MNEPRICRDSSNITTPAIYLMDARGEYFFVFGHSVPASAIRDHAATTDQLVRRARVAIHEEKPDPEWSACWAACRENNGLDRPSMELLNFWNQKHEKLFGFGIPSVVLRDFKLSLDELIDVTEFCCTRTCHAVPGWERAQLLDGDYVDEYQQFCYLTQQYGVDKYEDARGRNNCAGFQWYGVAPRAGIPVRRVG